MPNYVPIAKAANILSNANRVLVIGCSGGGKTTLSQQISLGRSIPLISIDRDVRWLPGWQERDRVQQRAILSSMVEQERWVMDGSGASTFDIRLPRTELVLWVRVPRYVALSGLASRVVRNYGRVRPLMAEGCPERFPDMEFLSYIWNFEKRHTPKFIQEIDKHGVSVPVCLLNSRMHGDNLLESMDILPHLNGLEHD